jgi:hypothetical protein
MLLHRLRCCRVSVYMTMLTKVRGKQYGQGKRNLSFFTLSSCLAWTCAICFSSARLLALSDSCGVEGQPKAHHKMGSDGMRRQTSLRSRADSCKAGCNCVDCCDGAGEPSDCCVSNSDSGVEDIFTIGSGVHFAGLLCFYSAYFSLFVR